MQIPASELERFLRVPPIDISVDADYDGGYTAQTMPALTSVDLGAEIKVKIWDYEITFDDPDYPELHSEGEFEAGSEEMFLELLTRTRNAFASMMFIGRLNVGQGGMEGLDEGDEANFNKVMDLLGDDFFEITLEKAIDARLGLLEKDAALVGGLQTILHVMREEGIRRGVDKEQRAKMTIGDAFGLEDAPEE